MSAADIARTLQEAFGISIHWRTIAALLSADSTLAARRKRRGQWQFSVMHKGTQQIAAAGPSVTLIDPDKAVTAVASLHAHLGALTGLIRVCDPYLDHATVEHLDACPAGSEIRLLTFNVRDSGQLRRLLAVARRLSVRTAAANVLHDRYAIDDTSMTILGTSLNGLGKKQAFVIKAGPDIRQAMMSTFDRLWATGTVWP